MLNSTFQLNTIQTSHEFVLFGGQKGLSKSTSIKAMLKRCCLDQPLKLRRGALGGESREGGEAKKTKRKITISRRHGDVDVG